MLGVRFARLAVVAAAAVPVAAPLGALPPRANARGELVNLETPLIQPLLVTADGRHVVAINEPDARVVVRRTGDLSLVAEIPAGLGLTAVAERPGGGEIWASAMHSSAVIVIDTSSWRVVGVLRPPATPAGIGHSATPGGIAFSADGTKAWVAATSTDAVVVYDAAAKRHLKTISLSVAHNGSPARLREPRALVRSGNTVLIGINRSGNRTAAGAVQVVGLFPEIINLDTLPGFSLPDVDIVGLSTADESVVLAKRAVGNLIFALAVHPQSGEILAASLDARNGEFIGEGSFPGGRVALNHLTYIPIGGEPATYRQVALDDLPAGGDDKSVAMPAAIAVDGQGRVYVAGYASSNIAVLDATGDPLGVLECDAGPRGLAVSPSGDRLYSLHRIAGSLSVWDISGDVPADPLLTSPIGLHDPTFDDVRVGRSLFHDATRSGGGSAGCFSCHPDLQQDGVGWDLSAYHDTGEGFTLADPPNFWRDKKALMVTQDCRSLEDASPYHWRGEQHDLEAFNAAFAGLLKGQQLVDAEFAALKAYLFSAVYPANPFQLVDRSLSSSAARGEIVFNAPDADSPSCHDCHSGPTGSRNVISSPFVTGKSIPGDGALRAMDTTQLRGMWTKQSAAVNANESGPALLLPVTGFGFDHTGSHRNVAHFIDRQFSHLPAPARLDLTAFLREFDSGLAPATALSQMLDVTTAASFATNFWLSQLRAGHCDLAVRGLIDFGDGPVEAGAVYDPALDALRFDHSDLPPVDLQTLVTWAAQGKVEVLVLGTPRGSGERLGIDRDRDGLADGDEKALGTDPADPDTDEDGFWDSYDDDPLVFDDTISVTDPPEVLDLAIEYVTANAARVNWRTDTFSPTRVRYGRTTDYGQVVGDPFPLPVGSNHWRRLHSVVLRLLDDGASYHFQVQTLGQNGVEGGTQDLRLTTLPDIVAGTNGTIRVADVNLDFVDHGGGEGTFTATVTVVSNQMEPVVGAQVNAVWTIFEDGEPVEQQEGTGGPTDADGVAALTLELSQLETGDAVDFTIPMFVGPVDAATPGVVDGLAARRAFAWSDNEVTSVEVTVP